jgi:hypothetical protein
MSELDIAIDARARDKENAKQMENCVRSKQICCVRRLEWNPGNLVSAQRGIPSIDAISKFGLAIESYCSICLGCVWIRQDVLLLSPESNEARDQRIFNIIPCLPHKHIGCFGCPGGDFSGLGLTCSDIEEHLERLGELQTSLNTMQILSTGIERERERERQSIWR